jgi:glycogen debranching enzyme
MVLQHAEKSRRAHTRAPSRGRSQKKQKALQEQWIRSCTELYTPADGVQHVYERSVDDLGGLRLFDHDLGPELWVPAAGVPWFVTVFGRDSLIASLQCMMVHAPFAEGALRLLAQYQATERNDWRDAQPGKIVHEVRHGELAHFDLLPHTRYYGTWDATSLYLITLFQAWRWLGDPTLIEAILPVAEGCLRWIDRWGDPDGDGFQEYQTYSEAGYENMGWKDAGDAVVYPDGSEVSQPKALCELQGYVYAAWLGMSEVYSSIGDDARGSELRNRAEHLKRRFNETFWMETDGTFAFGLDSEKRQIGSIVSNPGHCLWTGIVDDDKAGLLTRRLLADDLWSGWGIRTLSSANPAYDPFSYQRGSVWPHDNGIIAA